jgi:hypothetical protein
MRHRRHASLICSAAFLAAAIVFGSPAVVTAAEDWYVITIGGSPVGSVHIESADNEGGHTEIQTMRMVLNRMGSTVEMNTTGTTREDESGRLLAVDVELDMSDQSTTLHAEVEPGRVRLASVAGDATFDRELAYEGELIGPAGLRRLIREKLKETGDRAAYATFRPDIGMVVKATLELVGTDSQLVAGETVELRKVVERLADISMTTMYLVDATGKTVRSTTPGPFGEMATVLADAATARMATAGNELPEESYGATLLVTQVRLPEPRRSRRVVLEMLHRNPALGWPDLSAPTQTVLEKTADRLRLEVRRVSPATTATFPVQPAEGIEEFLEANAYIQSDDPEVRSLARQIVGDTHDIYTAAVALQRWVAENMSFDMGVVLAPSSEVLVNRRGTCTEYAMLLTTLARSLGIPARYTMGYVYVGGIYGGHAWTEVLIGDRWVGFDGAVPADGPVDAARIAFTWDSLANGVGRLTVGPALQLYGQVDASVVEYGLEGGGDRSFAADEDATVIDGDHYRNLVLDVAWTKPAGSSFVDLNLTWPETTLVGIEGGDGARATLGVRDRQYWLDEEGAACTALENELADGRQRAIEVAGRQAYLTESDDEAALAIVRGSELWLLTVRSPNPGAWLEQLAATLEL